MWSSILGFCLLLACLTVTDGHPFLLQVGFERTISTSSKPVGNFIDCFDANEGELFKLDIILDPLRDGGSYGTIEEVEKNLKCEVTRSSSIWDGWDKHSGVKVGGLLKSQFWRDDDRYHKFIDADWMFIDLGDTGENERLKAFPPFSQKRVWIHVVKASRIFRLWVGLEPERHSKWKNERDGKFIDCFVEMYRGELVKLEITLPELRYRTIKEVEENLKCEVSRRSSIMVTECKNAWYKSSGVKVSGLLELAEDKAVFDNHHKLGYAGWMFINLGDIGEDRKLAERLKEHDKAHPPLPQRGPPPVWSPPPFSKKIVWIHLVDHEYWPPLPFDTENAVNKAIALKAVQAVENGNEAMDVANGNEAKETNSGKKAKKAKKPKKGKKGKRS